MRAKRSNGVGAGGLYRCIDGKRRRMLNCAGYAPIRGQVKRMGEVWCDKCGHIYTELMMTGRHVCSECRLEEAAERARRLERAGIPMGWSSASTAFEVDLTSMRVGPSISKLESATAEYMAGSR